MEQIPDEKTILLMIDQITVEELSPSERRRQLAERLKLLQRELPVSDGFEPRREPGFLNKIKVFVKRVLRKMLRWYIDPILERQNRVNEQISAILRLLAQSAEDPGGRGLPQESRRGGPP